MKSDFSRTTKIRGIRRAIPGVFAPDERPRFPLPSVSPGMVDDWLEVIQAHATVVRPRALATRLHAIATTLSSRYAT
jgi:hypothetical protein